MLTASHLWEAFSYLCGALFELLFCSLPISLVVRKSSWMSHSFSLHCCPSSGLERSAIGTVSLLKRVFYKGCENGIRAQKTRMETGTGGAANEGVSSQGSLGKGLPSQSLGSLLPFILAPVPSSYWQLICVPLRRCGHPCSSYRSCLILP